MNLYHLCYFCKLNTPILNRRFCQTTLYNTPEALNCKDFEFDIDHPYENNISFDMASFVNSGIVI